jgi:beta-galactosidase
VPANGCGLPKNRYEVMDYCELLHVESAEALAHFGDNWYLGRPALTRNHRGKGCAWHIAARTGNDFLDDFHAMLAKELRLDSALGTGLPPPEGLSVRSRSNGQSTFLFLLNFGSAPIELRLAGGPFRDLLSGTCCGDCVTVPEGCFLVLVRPDGEAA